MASRFIYDWNDERIALLKELWANGLSCSQIASRLGKVTRGAVIGKVWRLGLAGRATTSRQRSHYATKGRKTQDAKVAAEKVAKAEKIEPTRKARPWMPGDKVDAPKQHYVPFVAREETVAVPVGKRVGILGLAENQCRWPIGEPRAADFHFCDRERFPGHASYCEHHMQRAIQQIEPVRRQPQQFPPLRVVEKQSETV